MASKKAMVKIGCCGFRSSRESYYELLPAVEVQHTFYQPPQISTLKRWRNEAPAGFEFTLKAWQLITHQASSPTYKRLKRDLTEAEKEGAGFFKPSEIVNEAWKVARDCARLFQYMVAAVGPRTCSSPISPRAVMTRPSSSTRRMS